MIYLAITALLLYLSYQYDIKGKSLYRAQWYQIMLVIFILLAGFRWRIGMDTINYLYFFYHEYPSLDNFSFKDYPIGKDPLFVLLNSIIKSLGGCFYHVQLIHATFVNSLLFIYIKRHSKYLFSCLFFYAIWFYLGYNTEIMRGSISIVICLFANDYILNKKWIKGYLLYSVAFLFHAQTIIIFLTPLLFFMRLNQKGIFFLGIGLVLGFFVGELIGEYLLIIDFNETIKGKAIGYAAAESVGSSRSIMGTIMVAFFCLTLIVSLRCIKRNNVASHLLKLEPFMMLFLLVQVMSIGFVLVYRYVEYYMIYGVFAYAELFASLAKNSRYGSSLAFFRALFLYSLLFIAIYSGYFGSAKTYMKYYPYSSIFDRTVVWEREKHLETRLLRPPKDYEY